MKLKGALASAALWVVLGCGGETEVDSSSELGRLRPTTAYRAGGDVGKPERVVHSRPPAWTEPVFDRVVGFDDEYDTEEMTSARRFVYRVALGLPRAMGSNRSSVAIPAVELFIDVNEERLRARFVGPGWPIDPGSEVRLRADSEGAYVFDSSGGRALPPGELAAWFQGGERPERTPLLAIRRDPNREHTQDVPGELVCALIAEWSDQPRDGLIRRCDGASPLGFRVGYWRAERTADMPVEVPRNALRADEADAPRSIEALETSSFLESEALTRIPAMRSPRPPPPPQRLRTGLEINNETATRVIVAVEGIAIGVVDAGSRREFDGFEPGDYRVSALRPLGAMVLRPTITRIPGARRIATNPRRERAEEAADTSTVPR